MKFISLQITGRCQLKCPFCLDEYKDQNDMSLDTFSHVLNYVENYNIKRVNLTGGEPLLHPSFPHIVKELKNRNINIVLYTNGLLLNTLDETTIKLIDKFIISVDSYDDSTNTPRTFIRVKEALEYVYKINKNITIATVVTNQNKDLEDLARHLNNYTWNLRQYMPIGHGANLKDILSISDDDFNYLIRNLENKFININIEVLKSSFKFSYVHITPQGEVITYRNGSIDTIVYF